MKKSILLLLAILAGLILNAQNVFIPDETFRTYLNTEFPSFMDASGDSLNTASAAAYTGAINLDLAYTQDPSVSGLEYFINLTDLEIDCHYLTSLDLSANIALTHLVLYMHYLPSLDLSSNIALTYIYINGSEITSLDLSNNTELTNVKCMYNELTNLNISNNPNITNLELSFNDFTSLDLSSCVALDTLECSENELTSLDLSNNTLLIHLNCNGNPITSLDLTNNVNLANLFCPNNNLSALDISSNLELKKLSVFGNQLTTLDLSSNIEIAEIYCYENPLESINLNNTTAITRINCENTLISELDLSSNIDLDYLACSNTSLISLDLSQNPNLYHLTAYDNLLLEFLNLQNGNTSNITYLSIYDCDTLSCIQVDDVDWASNEWTYFAEHYSFSLNCLYGIEDPNEISGKVWINSTCTEDGNEQAMAGVLVKTEPFNFYGITDGSGAYSILTDVGTYEVSPVLTNPLVNPLCPSPNYHTVQFDTLGQDTTDINFYNESVACALLNVDISSDRRRRCFTNNTIVEYCNTGYADATNVEVIVQMPEYVVLLSADFAYTSNDDGEFVFTIGDLAQGECGLIHIIDSVACIADITGLTQCTEAWITPPNDCLDTLDMEAYEAWDQSSIAVEGSCLGDSLVRFVISNTAEFTVGDMEAVQEYRILMDNALAETQNFQLNGGESLTIDYYANGQTIRLEADQHAMHPGFSHPEATIEVCGNDEGVFSTGFVNNLPQDDADYDVEIDCIEIIDSYDPNDKTVSPEGVSFEHYLEAGTILDYQIRFQNTGSDTAYTVVIVDSLSAHLDPATIEWGLSSHPYTIAVTGMGTPVLSFTFDEINLPDSTTNELQSHGYIKYKVAAYENLENNTEIHNTAHIFFDYNEAIVTNTAIVTISDTTFAHIPTKVETISNNDFEIYPNPTTGKVRIVAEGFESIEIYNLSGSLVKTSLKKDIDISTKAKGIYFVKVITSHGTQAKKLVLN